MLTKLSDYFTACLHPKRTFNKYTHEWIVTPCCRCSACAKSKASKYVSMINNMSENSAAVYFITLTFSPDCLPVADLTLNDNTVQGTCFFSKCQTVIVKRKPVLRKETRLFPYSDSFSDSTPFKFSKADLAFYDKGMPCLNSSSFLGRGRFGVLNRAYAVNFIKRLRSFLYAFSSLDFKYFLVAEYGSQSLRPHFHIVLFTSYSLRRRELFNIVSFSWKYGSIDVQSVKRSVANYVASYCSSVSSIPQFLRTESLRPFCLHSHFTTFTFGNAAEKKRLSRLYKRDSPYIVKATSAGYDLFPLPATLRYFAYPKCSKFRERSNTEIKRILCQFEREAIRQRTLNPVFSVTCLVPAESDEWFTHTLADSKARIKLSLTLHQLRDASLPVLSKSTVKHNCIIKLLDNSSYYDVYASYKVFKLAQLMGCSSSDIADHIITFYRGSSVHPLNFELSLLNYQYSCLEKCDSFEDVKFLYSLFNSRSSASALHSAGFDDVTVSPDSVNRFRSVVSETLLKSIKHKDRNSYYLYSKYHG